MGIALNESAPHSGVCAFSAHWDSLTVDSLKVSQLQINEHEREMPPAKQSAGIAFVYSRSLCVLVQCHQMMWWMHFCCFLSRVNNTLSTWLMAYAHADCLRCWLEISSHKLKLHLGKKLIWVFKMSEYGRYNLIPPIDNLDATMQQIFVPWEGQINFVQQVTNSISQSVALPFCGRQSGSEA